MNALAVKGMSFQRYKTEKLIGQFIADLEELVNDAGYQIVNKERASVLDFYKQNGVELENDFDLQVIQICRPEVSGPSLYQNPERAAFINKLVYIFTRDEMTEICMPGYASEMVADLLGVSPDDMFSNRLEQSFIKINRMIEEAL